MKKGTKTRWLLAGVGLLAMPLVMQAQDAKMNTFISNLMAKMTLDEKIGQLNLVTPGGAVTGAVVSQGVEENLKKGLVGGMFGITGPAKIRQAQELAVKQSRLHIPLLFGLDVIHGHKTVFPIPLGLSCSWDTALIRHSARIAATEASADGLDWAYSPMVDIGRDPRWGRVSEGSGEDTWLGSQIAKSMVKGYQNNNLAANDAVMACVKHFALYGAAEAGRDYNTVDMSRIKMYEHYLPPYKAAVDAGAGSIMSSFNDIDGIPASANKWLMTDLLRKQWGFNGFVVTDYTAISEMIAHGMGDLSEVSALSLKAGVDMDMVSEGFLGTLKQSLAAGKITKQEIETACRRILEAKYKLGLFEDPYRRLNDQRAADIILSAQNRQEARAIAARSFVLLKNENQVLPLQKKGTVALVGPLADNHRNMLGTWSVSGDFDKSVTVRQGLESVAGNAVNIVYAKGANISDDTTFARKVNVFGKEIEIDSRSAADMVAEAVAAANKSDVVVAVLGEAADMSGESSSRSDIGLPANQQALLKALLATGKPVVLVLFNGRPLTLEWENEHVPAILDAWFGGTEAGNAIADVLFGNYNPAGKITASFPRNVGQIPVYYNHKNTGRPYNNEFESKFKSNYLDVDNSPLYPFGYGLSYTQFQYSDVVLSTAKATGNATVTASVTVTNTGKYAGEEVVQLYIADPVASVTRSVKELRGFQKVMLQPGESKQVVFPVTTELLKFYNSNLKFDWEPGEFIIQVGTNSQNVKSAKVIWNK
ncbi:beta-glucosidase [Filimonas lacunae]|uniref:Periplasmic beta-glucosidase n=1 Tax=Filimonas lacunae TaxID=477680 RepID=A0A173M9Y4_9BACT|nr:beta-glucosidase BglX [Filimonas lacunae]BAV04332.1 periplasmic beta-glucosidase [Filimonas lacunae]SIT31052.1 beta-glucosidase [Filimonas lacunae]